MLFLTHLHCSLCAPNGSCSYGGSLTPCSLHEAGGQFLPPRAAGAPLKAAAAVAGCDTVY